MYSRIDEPHACSLTDALSEWAAQTTQYALAYRTAKAPALTSPTAIERLRLPRHTGG